jgi:hypothetical protein
MAAAFCAYVRKLTTLDILPQLNYSNAQLQQGFYNTIKTAAEMMNTKMLLNDNLRFDNTLVRSSKEDDIFSTQMYDNKKNKEEENEWRIYMPIFLDD